MLRGFISVMALTVASGAVATAAFAAEPANPAHLIAQKFASPTETAAPAVAKTETPKISAAKAAVAKPQVTNAERPPLDYEMEMLRRARAEQQATAKSPVIEVVHPTATPTAIPAPPAPTPTLPAAPVAAPVAPAVQAAVPAIPATPPVAAKEVAATEISTSALHAAAPAPPAAIAVQIAIPVAPATPPPAVVAQAPAPVAKAAEVAPTETPVAKPEQQAKTEPAAVLPAAPAVVAGPVAHASLLLALETGGASSKSGSSPTFDPILCMADTCFVSAGLNADAVKLSKLDALKLKTTADASPDSCKNKVGCVFRNVAIPSGAQLQVIELGSASHDPSRTSDAQLDASCKVNDGALDCDNPIATPDFRIWVVPEETARTAGIQAIEDAVADGLPHEDVARSTDK